MNDNNNIFIFFCFLFLSIYVGDMWNDMRHGTGTMTLPNGTQRDVSTISSIIIIIIMIIIIILIIIITIN
jgi:hypothetical protein